MLGVAHFPCISHFLGEAGVLRASLEHLDLVGQGSSLTCAVPSAAMLLNHHFYFTTKKPYRKEQRSHQGKTCLFSYLSWIMHKIQQTAGFHLPLSCTLRQSMTRYAVKHWKLCATLTWVCASHCRPKLQKSLHSKSWLPLHLLSLLISCFIRPPLFHLTTLPKCWQ